MEPGAEVWNEKLAELRAYVTARGAFPSSSKPGQKLLIGWWHHNRRLQAQGHLTPEQGAALDQVAKQVQDAKDAQRTGRTAEGLAQDARDLTVFRAQQALNSPYLIDGDREVLQLRVDNPTADAGVLADHLGISRAAYRSKLFAAMSRRPGSYRPPAPERVATYQRSPAARIIGVDGIEFDVMVKRGLLRDATVTSPSGKRSYHRPAVHAIRTMLAETVLVLAQEIEELAASPAPDPAQWAAQRRPAKKEVSTYRRSHAARVIGVSPREFDVMVNRGLLRDATVTSPSGMRSYHGHAVHAIREKLADTVLALAQEAKHLEERHRPDNADGCNV